MTPPSTLYGGILCAGYGSRMAPLTDATPKPLLPFLNTPLLAYGLAHMRRAQVACVALNLHHLAHVVPPVADAIGAQLGVQVRYAHEEEILGTAGGMRGIWEVCGAPEQGAFVVLNGDSIMNLDLQDVHAAHSASQASVTLVLRPKAADQPGKVWVDGAGQIVRLRDHRAPSWDDALEGSYSEFDFCGVHLIDAPVFGTLAPEFGDIITVCYGPMLERGERLDAFVYDGFWVALDTPAHLLRTQRTCLEQPGLFEQAPLPEPLNPGLYVYRPGAFEAHVKVRAPLLTGINVEVGQGAALGANVVADGVRVAPGAVVSDALLYGMGEVDGTWERCVGVAGKVVAVAQEDL